MTDEELRYWINDWALHYDVNLDEKVLPFEDRRGLAPVEVLEICNWLAGRGQGVPRSEGDLGTPAQLVELVARGVACPDELGALLILSQIPSFGFPEASGILAATQPDRFLVFASGSLDVHERLPYLSPHTQAVPDADSWLLFLAAGRRIARETGLSLRQVDRALNAASRNDSAKRSSSQLP